MKIAIWHNLGSGGGKRALYNHVEALKEAGHYLEAWTTDISSSDYLPLTDLIVENRKGLKKEYERIIKIKNPIKKEKRIIQLIRKHCIECVKEIEAKGFDLIFANSCKISRMPYIGLYTKLPAIVYLGEPNRYLYEAMPYNIWQTPYNRFKIKKIKRYFIDLFDTYSRRIKVRNEIMSAKSYKKILVNSLFSRENVLRSYGVDADVCYLGINTANFNSNGIIKEPFVVGLGSITIMKSIDKAIEVIGLIPKDIRPDLKWITNLIDRWYLNEITLLAKRLEVNFQIFEKISDSELVSIVSKAAIMIYTPRLEPFGLAPLEANACGTYVVAIAEGGVRESITNGVNGILINGYKKKEIAEIVKLFVTDLDLAKIRGAVACKFVGEYWNRKFMSDNLLSEIENVLVT